MLSVNRLVSKRKTTLGSLNICSGQKSLGLLESDVQDGAHPKTPSHQRRILRLTYIAAMA